MPDVKFPSNPLFLRDEELRVAVELLFYAYRDFTGEPDAMLSKLDLGRAHHRVIYFVGRYPGITVSELLTVLNITKQSLSRVLSRLLRDAYVEQRADRDDRRKRLLHLTDKGRELERTLTANQRARIARAYREAGADAVEGFKKVMLGIMDASTRELSQSGPRATEPKAWRRAR
jgi:DNA-binding MarR family transcriptional regulator